MTPEAITHDEPDEAPEVEEYEPELVEVHDGCCVILDRYLFVEKTGALAVMLRDGGLFILHPDSLKWRNVEPSGPQRTK